MSKHTPGPWEIHGKLPPTQTECEDFEAHTVTIGRGDLVIAESFAYKFKDGVENRGYPRVSDFEENVCNARLIAAAPELLEAAKLVLAWHDAEADFSGTTFWQRVDMCRESEAALRAAVTKATGVEQ